MAVYPQRRALNAPGGARGKQTTSNPFASGVNTLPDYEPTATLGGSPTVTTGAWWEQPGLLESDVQGFGGQTSMGGNTRYISDPWAFYQFAQDNPQSIQDILQSGDPLASGGPFDTYDPQLPQIDPALAEDPPWIADTLEQLLDHYESMLAPDYTGVSQFTPAVRGEIDRQIGGQLATAERGIRSSMGRSGMWNSGVAGQMEMMANMGAASASGQARAIMESQDQSRIRADRSEALTGMQDLYRQGKLDTERYGNLLAGLSPAFAAAMGPGLLAGPDYNWQDPAGWFGTNYSLEQLAQARQDALDAQDYDTAAMFESAINMVISGIDDPWLIAAMAGGPALMGDS